MTAPNRNTLWARILVDELAESGVERVVIAPGSRSTPLTLAADREDRIETYSHLDERSAGFFALGQGKRVGVPTALISTSGTGAVNFHPAVVEAHQSRTPLVVLTADRPPERWESGANQTIDQTDLYGSATRFVRTLPEPEPTARKLRSLRTIVDRAVGAATGTDPGPVHLNVPFRKPLEPIAVDGDVPADPANPLQDAMDGRDGPFVEIEPGTVHPATDAVDALERTIEDATRGVIVVGPRNPDASAEAALLQLAESTGFPVLADPLSGLRYVDEGASATVLGGYDGFIGSEPVADWPTPDVVLRFGASPTSKPLRQYLRDIDSRQFLVDPAGGWREATFTATDLVQADIVPLVESLADDIDRDPNRAWHDRLETAENIHWGAVEAESDDDWEGGFLASVSALAPDPSTLFVSNSMPVRDLDRYGRPRAADLTVLGNRGASGIDGITSTGLGAGSVTDEPLVIVTGDLAHFHDSNGLLALDRFGLDATIVLINNDGGGIFHMLPIEDFEPVFEEQFLTPHGLDFEPLGDLHDFEFRRVGDREDLEAAFTESVSRSGTQVIEVRTDAERSHRVREALETSVAEQLPQ